MTGRIESTGRCALVSGTSSDSHMWNLTVLALRLIECGFTVQNLGICVPVDELVECCLIARPRLIVLGSLNGHGYLDGERAVRGLRAEPELAGTRIVLGGKLGITGLPDPDATRRLIEAGCDAVYEGPSALAAFTEDLLAGDRMLAGAAG